MLKNTKRLLTQIFMVVMALSFLSWGATSGFQNVSKSVAIAVNGNEISVSELQKEYEFRLKEAERQFGGKLSPEFLQAIRLGNVTVDSIISSKLALSEAKELGFRPSDKALKAQIMNTPAFQDVDGNFNKEIYKNSVSNYGYSIKGYEKLMSEEMQKRSLYTLFANFFNSPQYLENLYKFQNKKINIRALYVNDKAIGALKAPSAADIKAYYDENKNRLQSNEQRDFAVLTVRASDLENGIQISDEEALSAYNEYPESFKTAEQRQARHILVATEEEAMNIMNQLNKGANFVDMAKKYSTDNFTKNKGGDLGYFTESDMVESFSQAAFSMEKNSISEPVKSPFGYHIIQLTDIKPSMSRTFDEVKPEIMQELKAEKAEDLYFDTLENVDDAIASGESFENIAQNLGITFNNYSNIEASNLSIDNATDILPTVFELEEGETSTAIDIEGQDTATVFISVLKINKPHILDINEARQQIVIELNEATRQRKIAEKAEALLVERKSVTSLNTLAQRHNLTSNIEEMNGINREGMRAPKWLKQLHINLLFAMKNGEELNTIVNTPEGMALVELINFEQATLEESDLDNFRQEIQNDMQDDMFSQFMLKKRSKAEIDLRIPSIQAAIGAGFVE